MMLLLQERKRREDSFLYSPEDYELESDGPEGGDVEAGDSDNRDTPSALRLRSHQMLKSSPRIGSDF